MVAVNVKRIRGKNRPAYPGPGLILNFQKVIFLATVDVFRGGWVGFKNSVKLTD